MVGEDEMFAQGVSQTYSRSGGGEVFEEFPRYQEEVDGISNGSVFDEFPINEEEVAAFKDEFEVAVEALGLDQDSWENEQWAIVASLVTPSVLVDAFLKTERVVEFFGLLLIGKTSVSMEQVNKRIAMDPVLSRMEDRNKAIDTVVNERVFHYQTWRDQPKDWKYLQNEPHPYIDALEGRGHCFTVVADLISLTIVVECPEAIDKAIKHLRETVQGKGLIYVKKDYCNGKLPLVYVYLPDIGLIQFMVMCQKPNFEQVVQQQSSHWRCSIL